ncbi:MAG: right-handed parallel beta-helix repeat-containing protein, partial [Planctomycetota bacterium]|nr:right-handed parallel beta-helix repeat-containing protein [Planctomycetota bacterium]
SGLPADETILSGAIGTAAATDNSRTVVKVNFAGTRAVTLDGLTIRDGRGDVGDVGGGFWISGSNVNIRNCLIRDNYSQSGGGLYMKNSSVFAEDSRFVDNQAEETGGKGGAVYVDLGTAASQFNANRCRFTGNYSEDGSVLYNNGRSISLMNCLINSNNVFVYGRSAPIHLVGAASVNSIVNCTASNNRGDVGTVILLEDAADLSVTNSIFWWNFEANGSNPYRHVIGFTNVNSGVTASHCVFTDETLFTGPGVTIGDPVFVDPDGADDILGTDDDNYRLSFGSPSLDSGVNQVGGNFLVDLDLNPRMLDLPSVANTGGSFGVGYIDRGCYERPITVCPADFDESGFVDSDDFVMFSEHFALGCTGAGQGAMGAEPACLKSADFDGTGFVDSDDFVAFVDAFNTPCNP